MTEQEAGLDACGCGKEFAIADPCAAILTGRTRTIQARLNYRANAKERQDDTHTQTSPDTEQSNEHMDIPDKIRHQFHILSRWSNSCLYAGALRANECE